jgi:hypothetical protein
VQDGPGGLHNAIEGEAHHALLHGEPPGGHEKRAGPGNDEGPGRPFDAERRNTEPAAVRSGLCWNLPLRSLDVGWQFPAFRIPPNNKAGLYRARPY